MESEKENRLLSDGDDICHSTQRTTVGNHTKCESRRQSNLQHNQLKVSQQRSHNNRRYDTIHEGRMRNTSQVQLSNRNRGEQFDQINNMSGMKNSSFNSNCNSFQKRHDNPFQDGKYKKFTNTKKLPFNFEVIENDIVICEKTAESMRNMYGRIIVDDVIISKINELAINAQEFLQLQQQNLLKFYDDKKQHDIQNWLASSTEEEQKRYWERMQKS